MKSRRIKIAVISESDTWKNIQALISANYYFVLPKSMIPESEDQSANFVPEFIQYRQSLAAFTEIGSDPFLRPFLYLYVVSVKNDEIDTNTIEKITKWIENNKILATTYLVILIQEDKKVFGNSKPINIEQITSSTEDSNDIIIFSVKQRKQTQDQLIEEIKTSITNHLIEDCQKYKNAINQRLKAAFPNPKLKQRLTVWRNLLLYFYGFYNISLKGFTNSYKKLAQFCKITLPELLNYQIDPEKVTTHPFTENQEPVDSLMFSLYGAMAVSYSKTDFMYLVNFFFKHFGFIRSKCVTPEDNLKVNEWGEKAIDIILRLGEMMSHPRVASNLLFKKLQLIKERNGSAKEIATTYRTLRKLIPGRVYMITSLDTGYLQWKSENRKKLEKDKTITANNSTTNLNLDDQDSSSRQDSIHIDFEQADEADAINNFTSEEKSRPSMLGWPNITSVLETIFKDKFSKGELDQALPYATRLMMDSSNFTRKAKVFKKISSSENQLSFKAPFQIKVNFKTDVFERVVNASTPFTLTAIVETPKWLPLNYDITHIRLIRPSGPSRMSMIDRTTSSNSILSNSGGGQQQEQNIQLQYPSVSHEPRRRHRDSVNSSSPRFSIEGTSNSGITDQQPQPLINRSRSQSLYISPSPSQDFIQSTTAAAASNDTLYSSKGLTLSVKNEYNEELEKEDELSPNKKFNKRSIVFKDVCVRAPGNWYVALIGFRYKNLTIYSDLMQYSYLIKVDKGPNAPITVDFPKVFNLRKDAQNSLKAVLKIDYSDIASIRFNHQLSFVKDIDSLIESCKLNEINLSVVDKRGDRKREKSDNPSTNKYIESDVKNMTTYKFERSLSKSNLGMLEKETPIEKSPLSLNSFDSTFEIPMLGPIQPSNSPYASIPPQKGTATFSDGSSTEFQIDKEGRLIFLPETFSPLLKVATIPFTFNITPKNLNVADSSDSDINDTLKDDDDDDDDVASFPESTALLVDSRIDAHKWQVAFIHPLDCPLICRSRIATKKVVHVELKNACDTPLTIENVTDDTEPNHQKIVIQPNKSYFLIHTQVNKPLKVIVSDGFGEPIEKSFKLDRSIASPELVSKIVKKEKYQCGVPINVEFELPKCSYEYLKNNSFAVIGKTKVNKFEGGKVNFLIIPISGGIVETPNMEINGVIHSVLPKYIDVSSSSTMSLGPFLDKSC